MHGVDSLIELIANLLRGRRAHKDLKTDFADFDWRPTLIALGIISIVVAALVVIFALVAQS